MTLPSNDDLIWRLRKQAQDGSNSVWVQADCCKAAERLEALEAENTRLREALDEVKASLERMIEEFGCHDEDCDICGPARAARAKIGGA